MADEHKTDHTPEGGGDTGTPEKESKPKMVSQEDVDRIIAARLAREREKYADYEKLKEELDKLRQQQKEREEAELSELEKLKKAQEEAQKKIEELNQHYEWRKNWEAREQEAIEKMMEEAKFSEKQIELVNALPLEKRRDMIAELKATQTAVGGNVISKQGGRIDGLPTVEEINEMRQKGDPRWVNYYRKLKEQGV